MIRETPTTDAQMMRSSGNEDRLSVGFESSSGDGAGGTASALESGQLRRWPRVSDFAAVLNPIATPAANDKPVTAVDAETNFDFNRPFAKNPPTIK